MHATPRARCTLVAALAVFGFPPHRAAAQGGYGQARTGPRVATVYRADAPPPNSGLPDPSLADSYGSTFEGQNLDGVGVFRVDAPNANFAYACTAVRVGPQTLLTAAHCVTDGYTGQLLPTVGTARVGYVGPGNVFGYHSVASVVVPPTWRGLYNDATLAWQDVAVLNFAEVLPGSITTYDIFDSGPLGSQTAEGARAVIAGFGYHGAGTGQPADFLDLYRHVGSNRVSFAADYAPYFGYGDLVTDFDDAEGHWNTTCLVDGACNAPTTGLTEAGTGPGDSGGPLFIDGQLAGLSSYNDYYCTPGTETTTCDPFVADATTYPGYGSRAYDSYGSLSAFAPVSANLAFIRASAVPEPSTFVLVGAGVVAVGSALRVGRRKV